MIPVGPVWVTCSALWPKVEWFTVIENSTKICSKTNKEMGHFSKEGGGREDKYQADQNQDSNSHQIVLLTWQLNYSLWCQGLCIWFSDHIASSCRHSGTDLTTCLGQHNSVCWSLLPHAFLLPFWWMFESVEWADERSVVQGGFLFYRYIWECLWLTMAQIPPRMESIWVCDKL